MGHLANGWRWHHPAHPFLQFSWMYNWKTHAYSHCTTFTDSWPLQEPSILKDMALTWRSLF